MAMEPKTFHYDRLVKSEDLNHHRSLFAGRCAEWFVEAGFIAAASVLPAGNIVCLKIHGLSFTHPMHSGDIARFESRIIHTGRTSLTVYVCLRIQDQCEAVINGFITFVHVNSEGKPEPHGLNLELTSPEELELNRQALALRK